MKKILYILFLIGVTVAKGQTFNPDPSRYVYLDAATLSNSIGNTYHPVASLLLPTGKIAQFVWDDTSTAQPVTGFVYKHPARAAGRWIRTNIGNYETVLTVEQRDSIPSFLRFLGLRVKVAEYPNIAFELKGGTDNSFWVADPYIDTCYLTQQLTSYVTLATNQEITGQKTFTGKSLFQKRVLLDGNSWLEVATGSTYGLILYNTPDDSINREFFQLNWKNNVAQMLVSRAASGIVRPLQIQQGKVDAGGLTNGGAPTIEMDQTRALSKYKMRVNMPTPDGALLGTDYIGVTATFGAASGMQKHWMMRDSFATTGTAGFLMYGANAVTNGSNTSTGKHLLFWGAKDSADRFEVDWDGNIKLYGNVFVNAGADTLSTRAYARSLLVNAGNYTAGRGIGITGTTIYRDTTQTATYLADQTFQNILFSSSNAYTVGSSSNQAATMYSATYRSNSSMNITTTASGSIMFNQSGNERARFAGSTGNFLVGTATDAGYKLDVNGSARIGTTLTITPSATTAANSLTTNSSNGRLQFTANDGTTTRRADNWDDLISYKTPTDGGSFSAAVGDNIVEPAGDLSSLTILLPSASNGDKVAFSFTKAITSITFSNGTLANTIAGAAAGDVLELQYYSGTGKWYRF